MSKLIFVSYKRADPTSAIAQKIDQKIRVGLKAFGFVSWWDKRSIEAGNSWSDKIDEALDQARYFLALLSDDYWDSDQCQRELLGAVERYEQTGNPRLLFVLTQNMNPNALELSSDRKSAKILTKFPKVSRLGEINFLGPYDKAGRLVRLDTSGAENLDDQLFELVEDIRRLP